MPMKAVWYDRQGPAAEVLTFGELADPEPEAGEVRIQLHASGVNPSDCNRRRGAGFAMEYPRIITHSDGAGVIDRVGAEVDPRRVGQRVWLYNGQRGRAFGTACEFITLAADLVSELPESVSFTEGACLGIPCMTAHLSTFIDGPVGGQIVLVTGGAGAVGNYAVQWAKWGGAKVVTTVSSRAKADHATRAGADLVVDYRTEDVAARIRSFTGGRGVDRIVDVDFGGNLATSLECLKASGGVVAYYASRGDPNPSLPAYELMRRNACVHAIMLPTAPVALRRQAQADIFRWLSTEPRLHTVAATFPLSATVRAHEAVEAGTKLGTVVVEIE
jgi:NADPH:quinone reductase